MKKKILRPALLVMVVLLILAGLWWKTIYFHYLMAQVARTDDGGSIVYLHEKIRGISPLFVSQLREIFFDPNENLRKRHACVFGLVAGNRAVARETFLTGIQSRDEILIEESIWGFSDLQDVTAFDVVLPFASSGSERIRVAVVDYFHSVLLPRSIPTLKKMRNDSSKYIQYLAEESLKGIHDTSRNTTN